MLNSNGREIFFSPAMWQEFCEMASTFNLTNVKAMQNYPDLPTRTPLHANVAQKPPPATAEDLS